MRSADRARSVSWDDWFDIFDRNQLAFLHQNPKADGGDSGLFKLVHR
jgi:hypothetical protein